MRTNAYHERYRAYRWTRRWPAAAWMALTEDGRALVILLLVLATFLWAYEAHAQRGGDYHKSAIPGFYKAAPAVVASDGGHPHIRKAWYYHLTPRQGGPSCIVGPFFSRATAADNLGSALYSHPNACHITGPRPPANCANTGNGYGYLKGTSYPPTWQIPDSGPVLLPFVATHLYGKWVRFWYNDDGSAVIVVKGQKPPTTPGQFTDYVNKGCPGWPWIFIGDNNGSLGDMVCN